MTKHQIDKSLKKLAKHNLIKKIKIKNQRSNCWIQYNLEVTKLKQGSKWQINGKKIDENLIN